MKTHTSEEEAGSADACELVRGSRGLETKSKAFGEVNFNISLA